MESVLGMAQPSWHYRLGTQWSAQQVLQASPSVDCNWNKVFSFWTYVKASHTPPAPRLRLLLLVFVSFAFSFQFVTRLAAVFAEEVDGFAIIP